MPVSPQDFALWSRMTGNPYPQSPAERMALAPEVYSYTRNIGRQGGPTMSPIRRAVDVVGKAALAAGALAGAAYLGSQYLNQDGESFGKLELDDEPGVPPSYPSAAGGASSSVVQASGDVTPPPTSDRFNQDLIVNQTSEVQQAKGLSPVKPTTNVIEQKPATQSEVISSQQHFSPGTEEEMLGQGAAERAAAFRKSKAYAVMQQQYPGLQDIESPTQPASSAPVVLKDVNVGEALRAKGLSLMGDPTDPHGLRVITEKGGEYLVSHPYAEHPKAGIRQTALQEQSLAHELLARAGVTPESAQSYFAEKFRIPAQSVVTESPVAAMAKPAQAPVTASVGVSGGASMREIREPDATPATVTSPAPQRKTSEQMEDERLARMAFGNMPMEQATALLAAARAQKGSKTVGAPEEAPTPIITTRQPQPVRVASAVSAPEARISPNEFLSAMSQQVGPVATYDIPSDRSKAVRGLAFYPGGEIGVQMGKRKSGPTEYAYATSDPYRLALSDYAEEGFPAGMGNIGGIVADKALAHQMGLQKAVELGGTIREKRQPVYAGLMSDADITSAGMGKSGSSRAKAMEQAERHFETKQIMQALEEKAARKRAGVV